MSQKKFPHEVLLAKHSIERESLPSETQEFIKDFNRTINMVNIRGGMDAAKGDTVNKLKRLDRVICDCLFDYIDEQQEKQQAITNQSSQQQSQRQVTTNNQTTNQSSQQQSSPDNKPKKRFVFGLGYVDEE